ncbi:hypothetical protein [Catellatospora sichuanensis]|uniref:hypothetical protein n=1 Tax=Catellatospora sichuanensis TaxID=1969805 RepID=UPI00164305C3|nr:hypothetical protein [Catellatospora sichuanensis]
MSFGTYARKVRDPALPYTRRVAALRSCVQLYRPIGFHATLSFLEELAGPYQRDEPALLRALDALTQSRTGWHADLREYAEMRRRAKRLGRRSPRSGDRDPSAFPGTWHGATQPAALHALRHWRRERLPALLTVPDETAEAINTCVEAALTSGGALAPQHRQLLAGGIVELRRRIDTDLWQHDSAAYYRAWNLSKVARLVEDATGPGTRSSRAAEVMTP